MKAELFVANSACHARGGGSTPLVVARIPKGCCNCWPEIAAQIAYRAPRMAKPEGRQRSRQRTDIARVVKIGRHATLRGWCCESGLQVRCLSRAPKVKRRWRNW